MKTEIYKEFATLIGRRLREAYVARAPDVLPETIELRLALLREAEARGGPSEPAAEGAARPQSAAANRPIDR